MALERELREIVAAVWSAADDGVIVAPVDDRAAPSGPILTGMVSIHGGWNGAVAVEVSIPAAERIARRVNGDVSGRTVRLAVAAVTEAIASRCQVLFPASVAAPATVVDGAAHCPGLVVVLHRAFRAGSDSLAVLMLQRTRRAGTDR